MKVRRFKERVFRLKKKLEQSDERARRLQFGEPNIFSPHKVSIEKLPKGEQIRFLINSFAFLTRRIFCERRTFRGTKKALRAETFRRLFRISLPLTRSIDQSTVLKS